MSFLIAVPELVQAAADDLLGAGASLADSVAAVAGSMTEIAGPGQDEVSVQLASVFSGVGDQFKELHARAQSFQTQFVRMLSAGADGYAGAEIANARQVVVGGGIQAAMHDVSASLAGAQAAVGGMQSGGAAAMMGSLDDFAATVAKPYNTLFSNTSTNLGAIANTVMADPMPLLHQFVDNQMSYAQQIGSAVQSLPSELMNVAANPQPVVQALNSANLSTLFPRQFIDEQLMHAQTIAHSLNAASSDFLTGLQNLPSALQTGVSQLVAGNPIGAVNTVGTGIAQPFLNGFAPFDTHWIPSMFGHLVMRGGLGELLPLLTFPAQFSADVANLLPLGSPPQLMAEHLALFLGTLTDTTPFIDTFDDGSLSTVILPASFDLLADAVGAPLSTMNALGSSMTSLAGAIQTGDVAGAAAAILDAPAVVTNGFLNGSATLSLPTVTTLDRGMIVSTRDFAIPVGGLLTPLGAPATFELSSMTGGLIPGWLDFESQLAQAIATTPEKVPPFFPF
jgi:PE family